MAGQAGRPKKATAAKAPITAENAPEVPAGPAPSAEVEETPEQKKIRELEEKIALLASALETQSAKASQVTPDVYDDEEGSEVLIHFIEDGFTAQGRVWYRGQELAVVVGSEEWNDTCDRDGTSWLSFTEADQLERYEKIYFRRGEWPGKKTYTAAEFSDTKLAPPVSELERADKLERDRRRAAEPLSKVVKEVVG